MLAACLIHALVVGVLTQTRAPRLRRRPVRSGFLHGFSFWFFWLAGTRRLQRAEKLSRGILHSQKRACGPWHDGAKELQLRSSFSCGCETRGSSSGGGDSVEMCASAWKCAPKNFFDENGCRLQSRKILGAAISEYISSHGYPQNTRSMSTFSQ